MKCHLPNINPENMRMKNYIIPTINKLILAFLALLGFSCNLDDPKDEYGAPCADFKVNGTVVDELTLNKLSNIQVIMDWDTVYSDENGNYEVKTRSYPSSQSFLVTFKDVDGELNGSYLHLDTVVEFADPEFEHGDGRWYNGEVSKEVNVKLSSEK